MKRTLLLLLALLLTTPLFSQTFSSKLGAIESFFTILSNDTLEVSNQLFVQRDETHFKGSTTENESYGAYSNITSWHLEFSSSSKIGSRERIRETERKLVNTYLVKLIDSNGNILAQSYLSNKRVRLWIGGFKNSQYNYSIDFRGLPIVALDNTASIEIQRITF